MLHTTRKNRHFTKFFRSGVDTYSSGVDPYFMEVFRGECDFIRGGSRGRVQGVCPPSGDLQFFNTTGILQKKKNYVIYWS